MKILVLSDRYPPYFEGGYELMCGQISEALSERGHDIHVLTTTFGVEGPCVEGHVHRTLHFLDVPVPDDSNALVRAFHLRTGQIRYAREARANYRITRALLRQVQPDLVFIWNIERASIMPALAAQDLGYPCVYRQGSHWLVHVKRGTTDVIWPKRIYQSLLLTGRRFDQLRYDAVIFNSESLRQSHLDEGFTFGLTEVIPGSLNEDYIPEHPPHAPLGEGQPLRLLYAGRVEQEKGPDIAVKAVSRVWQSGQHYLTLDIYGREDEAFAAPLRQYIHDNGLDDVIHMRGFIPREDLIDRYGDYDVLLFPSLQWEGLPGVIMEAMAHGLPVIASDIGGPRDIIRDGVDGFLVPPRQPEAMAEAIQRMLTEPDLHVEMGAQAAKRIREDFSRSVMLDHFETFLQGLLAEKATQNGVPV